MDINTQPLLIALSQSIACVFRVVLCLALISAVSSLGIASEIASIMQGLDTDGVATADKLLVLGDDVSRDPLFVRSFVQAARQVGRQGHWQKSIALLQRVQVVQQSQTATADNENSVAFSYTIDLAIASAALQCQEFDLATRHCRTVVADAKASAQHRAAAFPLLVKALQSAENFDEAAAVLHQATGDEQGRLAASQLAEQALSLGSVCLAQKRIAAASLAYQDCLRLIPDGPRAADAMLGAAWAAALGAEVPEIAAVKLAEFVTRFPQHDDAPHALRALATCLDQANQTEKADAGRVQLLEMYPRSDAADAILSRYTHANSPWPPFVRTAWQSRLNSNDGATSSFSVDQAAGIFHDSLQSGDDSLWQLATQRLVKTDHDGTLTETLLKRLTAESSESLAEHLAIDLILYASKAADSSSKAFPAASESACRWAGESERWSMLALAADELGVPGSTAGSPAANTSETPPRSVAIDRMLAESLMQTQRPADAMRWWDRLIDDQGVNDFATLMRGAETSVAHGDVETATRRVDAAKAVAGETPFNRSLTQILSAQLAIRRAHFDEARDLLSEVVRAADPSPTLRPRAQWLVGETYFMQQRYADAIDAYRRVDAMDAAGQWAPAALLQAGKAFEKLGRSRDAAVCYTALLTRFGDWPHAGIAQTRLATLKPSESFDSSAPILR